MVKYGMFFAGALLMCAGCAANAPPPVAPTLEPSITLVSTEPLQKPLDAMASIPLDDTRHLLVSVPDRWTFSHASPRIVRSDAFPGPCGVIADDPQKSVVLIIALDDSQKTADEEARGISEQLTHEPGIPEGLTTTSAVIPFADNAQGATFSFSAGEFRGFVTVRHLGEKHDTHVAFMGRWPASRSRQAVEVYWKTVLGTNVW